MTGPARNTDSDGFVSWREFLTSAFAPSLALVCLAVWLHAADSLIVATMLPSIVSDVGGAALVGWSVSLYEIASVVAGAASALLTMRHGLRAPMSFAAALFGLGCLLSAVSPSMAVILVGRALQGLGGGGLVAMAFVAVGVIFPRRYTARALAAVSTFWGISAFLGPLIGGFFVEYATWRWGFGFFAFQAFGLSLWIALRPDQASVQTAVTGKFPLRRLALLCLAVLLVSSGGIEVKPLQTSLLVGAGILCLAVFLRLDGRAEMDRLLPKLPFSLRTPTGASLLMILSLSIATIALTAFGPLLTTAIHGVSALTAGYIVACSSIGWTIAAVLVSGSPERLDRQMIAAGITMVVISIVGFLYAVPNGPVWLIAVFAAMDGAGFGLAWTFILRRTTSLADSDEIQRISGAIPTVQRLGYALGAAYVGIVANAVGFASIEGSAEAAEIATWIYSACLPFALLGLVAMFALVRKQPASQSTILG
ncbi:MFS transporter [Planktotalea sp.]|uniref:MFS transporter n=1 Tax=Planktotalea sp. TaxID=2029877 RepID=UPI003D6BCA24